MTRKSMQKVKISVFPNIGDPHFTTQKQKGLNQRFPARDRAYLGSKHQCKTEKVSHKSHIAAKPV